MRNFSKRLFISIQWLNSKNKPSWSKTARNGSPIKKTAGGSVFAITDRKHVFITVQTSSQIK